MSKNSNTANTAAQKSQRQHIPSDVRAAAARVLSAISKGQGSLANLIPETQHVVDERNHALLQALCYGVCRNWEALFQQRNQLMDKPLRNKDADVAALIMIGLYQLFYMRIPDHAAIDATVNAAKSLKKPWASKLINGVLREAQRRSLQLQRSTEKDSQEQSSPQQELDAEKPLQLLQPLVTLPAKYEHPDWLRELIEQQWPDAANNIFAANLQQAPMSLRVNSRQLSRSNYLEQLHAKGIKAEPCKLNDVGITLKAPVDVQSLPGFSEGEVSVQDVHAQLAADLLNAKDGDRVLDACAAPGGKTAHILEAAQCQMLALDINPNRLALIESGLARLNLSTELQAADGTHLHEWWDQKPFDRILLDAPCSATGVIRRNPDIKLTRRATDIQPLVDIQAELLQSLWACLKPGGRMVYATCSVLQNENAQQMQAFLNQTPDAELADVILKNGQALSSLNQANNPLGCQLFPSLNSENLNDQNTHNGDGFYYAVLDKSVTT